VIVVVIVVVVVVVVVVARIFVPQPVPTRPKCTLRDRLIFPLSSVPRGVDPRAAVTGDVSVKFPYF